MVQVLATVTGILLFVETSISSLTVGTLYRPIFDKLKIPREKLAYIADSSSAPSSILIPFNAWGAFIMGLLLTQGIDKPFSVMIASIKYNFYPLLAIAILFFIILSKKDFGLMKKAEKVALDDNASLPIYYYLARNVVSPKIKGYQDNAFDIHRSRWMSIEE